MYWSIKEDLSIVADASFAGERESFSIELHKEGKIALFSPCTQLYVSIQDGEYLCANKDKIDAWGLFELHKKFNI